MKLKLGGKVLKGGRRGQTVAADDAVHLWRWKALVGPLCTALRMRIWVLILAVFWRHPELLPMFGETTVALGAWPRYNDESGFSIEAVLKVPRAALYVDAWLGLALPLLRLVLVYPAAEWSSNLRRAAAVPLGVVLAARPRVAHPAIFNPGSLPPAAARLRCVAAARTLALAALPTWGDGRVMLGAIEEQRKVATFWFLHAAILFGVDYHVTAVDPLS